jgi:hypothetical protein
MNKTDNYLDKHRQLTKYNSGILLICLLLPPLLPFIELSIFRAGYDLSYSDLVNSFVLLIASCLLLLVRSVANKWQILVFGYLLLKIFQSIQQNVAIHDILITFVTIMFFYIMYGQIKLLNSNILLKYIKITSIFLLSIQIASSEINLIIGGGLLPLLFQNISLILVLVSLLWVRMFYAGNGLNYWLYLLLTIIIYTVSMFFRSENISHVTQTKFLFLLLVVTLLLVIALVFKRRIVRSFYRKKSEKRLLFFIFSLSVIFILSYSYLIIEYGGLLDRSNSASVRSAVNQVMLTEVIGQMGSLFFGYGIGSSSMGEYDIGDILGRHLTVPAHSGLYIFFYEHGVVGLLFMALTVIKSISGLYKKSDRFKKNYFGPKTPFFIVIFIVIAWIGLNLIIIFSIPGPDPFWNSGLSLYVMLWVVIIRDSSVIISRVRKQ